MAAQNHPSPEPPEPDAQLPLKVCEALEEAFGAWIKRNIGIKSGLSMTPFKERRNRADPEDEEDQDGERQRQASKRSRHTCSSTPPFLRLPRDPTRPPTPIVPWPLACMLLKC